MKCIKTLPDDYKQCMVISMQKSRRNLIWTLYSISFAILIGMIFLGGLFAEPFWDSWVLNYLYFSGNITQNILLTPISIIILVPVVVLLNNLIQAIILYTLKAENIKSNWKQKPPYHNVYCTSYITKRAYLMARILPDLIIGFILLVLTICFPASWFWLFYLLLTLSIVDSVGDFYIAFKLNLSGNDSLIYDCGDIVKVYCTKNTAEQYSEN